MSSQGISISSWNFADFLIIIKYSDHSEGFPDTIISELLRSVLIFQLTLALWKSAKGNFNSQGFKNLMQIF